MNYFNYYTEIEDAFVRRRGKHLFLSPMDWALMETWKEQGIPLHIILRGIERAFDSFEAKPRKRSVKSLLYCQEEVEAQYAEWLESRVGASPEGEARNVETEPSSPFSPTAIGEHLESSCLALTKAATARRHNGEDDFSEALSRAAALINEIKVDMTDGVPPDARKLEDSLTGLERMLSDALLSAIPSDQLNSFKREVKEQLAPYRKQMEDAIYQQTLDNLLLKRLREQFAVPRLSLFYL
jgi:predicted ribosome quality control (RQC) complex YloA/Tae2 family protein